MLDRLVKQSSSDSLGTTWVYDSKKIGLLSSVLTTGGIPSVNRLEELEYDEFSRVKVKTQNQDDETVQTTYQYDKLSRLTSESYQTVKYPIYFNLNYTYDKFNKLVKIESGKISTTILDQDEENRILSQLFGNGVSTLKRYHEITGSLVFTSSKAKNELPIHQMSYRYNSLGNLIDRTDLLNEQIERIEYDQLNRISVVMTENFSGEVKKNKYYYDEIGNILQKPFVGDYEYESEKPHAVTAVVTPSGKRIEYVYDPEGNMASGNGRKFTYNAEGFVKSICTSGSSMMFLYSSNGNILKKMESLKNGKIVETRFFGAYKQILIGNEVQHRFSVQNFAVVNVQNEVASIFYFSSTDHLGSPEVMTGQRGYVSEKFSYDPFGTPRNPLDWGQLFGSFSSENTERGFAFHVELSCGLVHMGARLYDPFLGRFISADPTIQFPEMMQDFNRYSYVLNNPLTLIDPNGYGFFSKFFGGIGKAISRAWHKVTHAIRGLGHAIEGIAKAVVKILKSPIVQVIARVVIGAIAASFCGPACFAIADSAFSAAMTKLSGGSWADAFKSAFVTFVEDSIGLSSLSASTKFLLGGVVGATQSYLNGGSPFFGFFQGAMMASSASFRADPILTFQRIYNAAYNFYQSKFVGSVMSKVAKSIGIKADIMDIGLEILSFIGGPRKITPNGEVQGFSWHIRFTGASSFLFDFVDAVLVYQGLPSATTFSAMFSGTLSKITGGHSLGAAEVALMKSYGLISGKVTLLSLPFGLIGPTGTRVVDALKDPVSNFGYLFNPNAVVIPSYPGSTSGISDYFEKRHSWPYQHYEPYPHWSAK